MLDRMDEALEFPLPGAGEREKILKIYIDSYIARAGSPEGARTARGAPCLHSCRCPCKYMCAERSLMSCPTSSIAWPLPCLYPSPLAVAPLSCSAGMGLLVEVHSTPTWATCYIGGPCSCEGVCDDTSCGIASELLDRMIYSPDAWRAGGAGAGTEGGLSGRLRAWLRGRSARSDAIAVRGVTDAMIAEAAAATEGFSGRELAKMVASMQVRAAVTCMSMVWCRSVACFASCCAR